MKIWVDADACPKMIKDILFRAAVRTKTSLTLVANSFLTYPNSPFINAVQVEKGFDGADNYIVTHLDPNDLVITADIPLAAEVIEKKGIAEVLRITVDGMIPRNKLRAPRMKNLIIK